MTLTEKVRWMQVGKLLIEAASQHRIVERDCGCTNCCASCVSYQIHAYVIDLLFACDIRLLLANDQPMDLATFVPRKERM